MDNIFLKFKFLSGQILLKFQVKISRHICLVTGGQTCSSYVKSEQWTHPAVTDNILFCCFLIPLLYSEIDHWKDLSPSQCQSWCEVCFAGNYEPQRTNKHIKFISEIRKAATFWLQVVTLTEWRCGNLSLFSPLSSTERPTGLFIFLLTSTLLLLPAGARVTEFLDAKTTLELVISLSNFSISSLWCHIKESDYIIMTSYYTYDICLSLGLAGKYEF